MIEKKLGKISHVKFGHGGYQDVMIGLSLSFEGPDSWGVSDWKGTWAPSHIECTPNSKWTEEDRDKQMADTMRFIDKLLSESKKSDVTQLKGIPVEVTFDGNVLKEWRILKEVL